MGRKCRKIFSGQQWRGQGKPHSPKGTPSVEIQRHKIAELFRELKSCDHSQHFLISSLVDSRWTMSRLME